MQIRDLIAQMGGLHSVARELGVSSQQAQTGAAALLPSILGGIKQQAQTQGGVSGLGGLLGGLLGGERGSGGGLAFMLDANGDDNLLDDILGMAGKLNR